MGRLLQSERSLKDFPLREQEVSSDDGWTTVIVRSKQGEKVFKEVVKAGLVEAEEIDDKAFAAVVNTARSKRNKLYKLEPHH